MPKVFLCYSHHDEALAESLERCLREAGMECWRDLQTLPGRFTDQIEAAIRGCGAFVVLVSAHSVASTWVQDEISVARHYRRTVIPVVIDDTEVTTLPGIWAFIASSSQSYTFGSPTDPSGQRIVRALQEHLARDRSSSRSGPHAVRFRRLLAHRALRPSLLLLLMALCAAGGYWVAARRSGRAAPPPAESGDPNAKLMIDLATAALSLRSKGDPDGAVEALSLMERTSRKTGDDAKLQWALGIRALLSYEKGDTAEAFSLYRKQEEISRRSNNSDGLRSALGGQATILTDGGYLESALRLFRQQEQLSEQIGNIDGLQQSLGNQAVIRQRQGNLTEASNLLDRQEKICRDSRNQVGLQACLGIQAGILQARGDLDGALALYEDQESICRKIGCRDGLARELTNRAMLLAEGKNRPSEALVLVEEAYKVALSENQLLAAQVKTRLDYLRQKAGQ